MIIGRTNNLWNRIAQIWPRWWGLSLSWVIIVATIWLLPGERLYEWFGGPLHHATVDLISFLLIPPAGALLVLLVLSPVNPVGNSGPNLRSSSRYPATMGRFQKFVVMALALSIFITLILANGIEPGPKLKRLVRNLFDSVSSSSRRDTELLRHQNRGVEPRPNFGGEFDEIEREAQEDEKARLVEELRKLQLNQNVTNDIKRLRSTIELEKARLVCEKVPATCDIEAPDEQN